MNRCKRRSRALLLPLLAAGFFSVLAAQSECLGAPAAEVIEKVQPRIVKIHGAGGYKGLEAYQSGFLISSSGHVLTVWSYVLDTDEIAVTLDDGRRFFAKLVGADPQVDLAILKLDATNLPHFDLASAADAESGTRVLAFSNLYGVATGNEAASVQHGTVSVKTKLQARRGVYETPYKGDIYVLDAMTNNPGASGGALTDRRGRLLAMLGKELRNTRNNTWLNYAVPIGPLKKSIQAILSGKAPARRAEDRRKPKQPLDLAMLGIVMVPDISPRTPPFIDRVFAGTPAAKAGLRIDDLVLLVNEELIRSCQTLVEELAHIDRVDKIRMTIMRDQELIEVTLAAPRKVAEQ